MARTPSTYLGKARHAHGLSQKKVGEKYGVDSSYIGRLEIGDIGLTRTWIDRFSELYGIEKSDIEKHYPTEGGTIVGDTTYNLSPSGTHGTLQDSASHNDQEEFMLRIINEITLERYAGESAGDVAKAALMVLEKNKGYRPERVDKDYVEGQFMLCLQKVKEGKS